MVYDCCDDFAALFPQYAHWLRRAETDLAVQADHVFASSHALVKGLESVRGGKVNYLPNGVDFDMFNKNLGVDVPTGSAPVIGFVGAVGDWVDVDLLVKLANLRPDWTWQIVGPVHISLPSTLPRNLRFSGEVPFDYVPSIIEQFSVCLVPFRTDDKRMVTVNSNKFYQYLACGKPVVSAPIPEALLLAPLVLTADTIDAWIQAIGAALVDNGELTKQKRIEFAQGNSWGRRALEIMQVLDRTDDDNGD